MTASLAKGIFTCPNPQRYIMERKKTFVREQQNYNAKSKQFTYRFLILVDILVPLVLKLRDL